MIKINLVKTAAIFIGLSTLAFLPCSYAIDSNPHVENMSKNSGLDPKIIKLGLKAYHWAESHAKVNVNKGTLTIINYDLPSTQPRLYVFNLKNDQVVMKMQVAHGSGSGALMATKFSNQPESKETSLGVFVSGNIYQGKHGFSRKLIGLEKGINDNAAKRALVIHAAPYVSEAFAKAHPTLGLGRSWGCIAVNPGKIKQLVSTLDTGTVIFSYAKPENNDKNLLAQNIL